MTYDYHNGVASMETLVCFAAQVAMKLRDDYGISVDTLKQRWFAANVHRLCNGGYDVSSAAFIIANERA